MNNQENSTMNINQVLLHAHRNKRVVLHEDIIDLLRAEVILPKDHHVKLYDILFSICQNNEGEGFNKKSGREAMDGYQAFFLRQLNEYEYFDLTYPLLKAFMSSTMGKFYKDEYVNQDEVDEFDADPSDEYVFLEKSKSQISRYAELFEGKKEPFPITELDNDDTFVINNGHRCVMSDNSALKGFNCDTHKEEVFKDTLMVTHFNF